MAAGTYSAFVVVYTFENIANENNKIMKKGVLIVMVLVGMLSSCSMKTSCPTYMYHPGQQKDIRVQIDKPINHSVSEVEEAS